MPGAIRLAASAASISRVPDRPGQIHHGGGQGFLNGSASGILAIPTFMKAGPAGIEQQGRLVLEQGELHLYHRAALLKPGKAVDAFQAFHDRFLDDGLAVGNTVQGGAQRPSLNRERILFPDPVFPGQGPDSLEELLKAHRPEAAQMHLDPLSITGADVGPRQQIGTAAEKHPAVLDPDVLRVHPFELISQDPFDAKQTGRRVFPFFHSPFPVLSYPFAGRAIIPNQKAGISARFPHNYLNFLVRAASDFFLRFTEGFS